MWRSCSVDAYIGDAVVHGRSCKDAYGDAARNDESCQSWGGGDLQMLLMAVADPELPELGRGGSTSDVDGCGRVRATRAVEGRAASVIEGCGRVRATRAVEGKGCKCYRGLWKGHGY